MAFIKTIKESEASGAVAQMYAADRDKFGYLPNFTLAFSHRPNAYAAWLQLNGAIKANMNPRRYELATMAAARRLRSSYCMLAHGSILIDGFLSPDSVRAVVDDHRAAGLEPVEVAVMDLADKVANDATSVTQQDIDRLRSVGLTDGEILDIVLAAAARAFFSKTLDALGVAPDSRYAELDSAVREALTVGRAIADA
jgi:uncharacterized peroxidase-related enzyme